MKYHVFKKEFCPAKDSVCKDCQNKGHWAKSVMCPKPSKPTSDPIDHDKKVTAESSKPNPTPAKPTLKVISADQALPVTSDVSVKTITIPSVGKHYYTDFILGTHNWKQKCMIDPSSNINCVGYDWITRFDTPEWSYNLECGSIKTALGTPACQALSVIDDDWPISTLLQNLNHTSYVHTLNASTPQLLSDLNWQHTCTPQSSESLFKVSSVVANGQNMTYSEKSHPTSAIV